MRARSLLGIDRERYLRARWSLGHRDAQSIAYSLTMMRSRTLLLTLTMSIGSAAPARAQAWPAGSVGFDKAIYAKV